MNTGKDLIKVIHPCDYDIYHNGRKYPIFCKIMLEDGELSITGVISPLQSGNARGGCGQIDMEFKHRDDEEDDSRYSKSELINIDELRFSKGWNSAMWFDFLHIWNKYHLNKWNKIELPTYVIDFLKSLPKSDKIAAWV